MGEREPEGWGDVDVLTLPFRGGLVDWRSAVESVLYEVARHHGESPLDRGRALRRRLEALETADRPLAAAFEALARERGYRRAGGGAAALQRLAAGCRPYADVAPALERAMCAGLPVVAVADADPAAVEAALRPLDGAIRDVVTVRERGPRPALAGALRRAGVPPARVLHVGTSAAQLRAAASLGVRAAWLNRGGVAPRPDADFAVELRSLHGLVDFAAGRPALAAG
jgi:FMN phosphatase YigB (HAD superfamily)